jgi:hypothetical protein
MFKYCLYFFLAANLEKVQSDRLKQRQEEIAQKLKEEEERKTRELEEKKKEEEQIKINGDHGEQIDTTESVCSVIL